jgi:hypothetical protein
LRARQRYHSVCVALAARRPVATALYPGIWVGEYESTASEDEPASSSTGLACQWTSAGRLPASGGRAGTECGACFSRVPPPARAGTGSLAAMDSWMTAGRVRAQRPIRSECVSVGDECTPPSLHLVGPEGRSPRGCLVWQRLRCGRRAGRTRYSERRKARALAAARAVSALAAGRAEPSLEECCEGQRTAAHPPALKCDPRWPSPYAQAWRNGYGLTLGSCRQKDVNLTLEPLPRDYADGDSAQAEGQVKIVLHSAGVLHGGLPQPVDAWMYVGDGSHASFRDCPELSARGQGTGGWDLSRLLCVRGA